MHNIEEFEIEEPERYFGFQTKRVKIKGIKVSNVEIIRQVEWIDGSLLFPINTLMVYLGDLAYFVVIFLVFPNYVVVEHLRQLSIFKIIAVIMESTRI